MLHVYMTLYGICFIATIAVIIILLLLGIWQDREEAKQVGTKPDRPPTAKQWIVYIVKASLVAFVVSFAAPLTLMLYVLALGCMIVSIFADDR